MKKTKLDKLPMAAAMLLVVFIVAACAIRLRDDENQTPSAASAAGAPDPLATKLAECRSVTDEQKDALFEAARGGSPLFVQPKDEDRLPSGYPSVQQSGKEK